MPNICGIVSAESNRASVRYLAEDSACWGVQATSGASREMRITSSSLVAEKTTAISSEIRADRMVSNIIETAANSGGDVDWEFSAGSQDDFFQAFLLGAWSRPMTFDFFQGDIISVTSTSIIDISGGDYTDYFPDGRRIKCEGFTTPANNDYYTVASTAFASGVTQITVTGTPLVIEAASAFGKVMDANDVVILKNTDVRMGTAGASTIDTNGNNGFASAIAAKQIVVGQRLYVQGLGYDVGTVQLTAAGTDTDTLTINDGVQTVVFELDSDSAFTRGNVSVAIGVDAATTAANLQVAIMRQAAQGKLRCTAAVTTDTVTVRNTRDLMTGNGAMTETGASMTVVDFTGGDDSLNGVFVVTNVTDDVLSVLPKPSTEANAGGLAITLKGSHLRNPGDVPSITKQSFTLETGFTDVGQYFKQTGMRVGSFEMAVNSGEIVTGKFAFQGKETTSSQASTLGNAPYDVLDSTSTEVMNATVNVGTLYKNSAELSTAVQSIEIKGEASLRTQSAVSNKFPAGIGVGRFNLSGTIVSYFETLEMFDDFINHNTISIGWDFRDNAHNYYFFSIPAIKINTDPIAPGGIDQDVMEELEWVAQRDPNLNTQFMMDRFSSLLPTAV